VKKKLLTKTFRREGSAKNFGLIFGSREKRTEEASYKTRDRQDTPQHQAQVRAKW